MADVATASSGRNTRSLREEVPVTPEVVAWARKHSRRSVATASSESKLKSLTVKRIEEIENDNAQPTISEVLEFARLFRRPFAFFFLPVAPNNIPEIVDRRSLPRASGDLPERLSLAISRARELQEASLDLVASLEEDFTKVPTPSTLQRKDPEQLAEWVLEKAGLEITLDGRATDRGKLLQDRIDLVESLGVLVFQITFPLTDARAFSIGTQNPPAIVLNYDDAIRGRLFSLFHELAHILLRQDSICNMSSTTTWAEEKFCNRFAAASLLPKFAVDTVMRKGSFTNLDDLADYLSSRSGASVEASFRRLVDLGHATMEGYLQRKPIWDAAYRDWWKRKKAKRGGPNPNPAGTARRKSGRILSGLVVEGLTAGYITRSEASHLLHLPVREISKLSQSI